MWIKQSPFHAVDRYGNKVFLDVDDFGCHWLMWQRKGDPPTPIQKCHYYDAKETFDWFIKSQNDIERQLHFMQGTTCWRW